MGSWKALTEREMVNKSVQQMLAQLRERYDRLFSFLILLEWVVLAGVAAFVTLMKGGFNLHLSTAQIGSVVVVSGVAVALATGYGWRKAGERQVRYLLAFAHLAMSGVLIYLTNGRDATLFHVFGTLAFLAFYRDIRVMLAATVVVFAGQIGFGLLAPEILYGASQGWWWYLAEHLMWVVFEVYILTIGIRASLSEMQQGAERQASLEMLNCAQEQAVQERTSALRSSEEGFRRLFHDSPIGLYYASPEGFIRQANPALLEMLKMGSVEDLQAQGASIVTLGIEPDRACMFGGLPESGLISGWKATLTRKDGSKIFARESIRAVRGGHGSISHFQGTLEDVSEQRSLEERFLQAQKTQAIGQLAGGVAHDFNNILTAVLGYADLILGTKLPPEEITKHVKEIKKAGQRASSLTRQLLAFSRKQVLSPAVIQINTVVADLEPMLRRMVGEDVDLYFKQTADLRRVKADACQLQQVLLNLVVNARDALPQGGKIVIETRNVMLDENYSRIHPEVTPGPHVVLSVSDNGMGMSPDVLAHIFEPFFTTKKAGEGTGLGLCTCDGVVRQSGGHMTVNSQVGAGTTMKVYLPCTLEAESAIAEPETAAPPETGREKIHGMDREVVLLVEDEPMVLKLGTMALRSMGYEVHSATNGREALEQLAALGRKPDLLFTDVIMPEMGGHELVQLARQEIPDLRVLYSSGYSYDVIERTDLLDAGIFFIQKPYALGRLAEKVREVLDCNGAVIDGPTAATAESSEREILPA